MPELAYTPFIWPFVASLAITVLLGVYAYRHRHLPAATLFAWLMLALTIWTFCYTMELVSVTLAGKIFWASAKYFGSTTAPVLWFILALRLTRNEHWLTPPLQFALSVFVIATCLVVFTNEFHHWYWTNIYLLPEFPETQSEHGFFFWIYAVVTYSLILTGVVLFFQYYRTTPAFYRIQALLMVLGGFVPLAGRIIEDFLSIDLFPKVDNIILLFLGSGIFFAIAIFRYGAFHIMHIAHNLVIHNIDAGIIILDMSGRVLELNPYAAQLAAVSDAAPIDHPLHTVIQSRPQIDVQPGMEQEVVMQDANGERWFHIQTSQIIAENGAPAGYTVVLFDITARKQAELQLVAMARTDPLTGVMNRRYFYERAEAEFTLARRHERTLAIVMFDIDHFKKINDTYGHLAGDAAIKSVAAETRRQLRSTDLFARYGGEEFICLLIESNIEDSRSVAERMRHAVAEMPIDAEGQTIPITISLGVALMAQRTTSLSELINNADQALYQSKTNGRNQTTLWEA